MTHSNLEVCASRYLRGVFLYQAWRVADDQMKKPIEQEIFQMLDVSAEEMAVLAKVVEAQLPKTSAVEPEPSEDE